MEGECNVAAVNGPQDVVLSGTRRKCRSTESSGRSCEISSPECESPLHSSLMNQPLMRCYHISTRSHSRSQFHLYDIVHGRLATAAHLKSSSHWAHHMLQPVRFHDSVRTLRRMKCDTFVEIGSGSTLLRLVRKCIDDDDDDVLYVSSVDESGHIDRALKELKKSEQVERRSSTVNYYVWRDLDEVEIVKDNVEKTPLLTQFVLESIAEFFRNRSISLDDSLVRSGLDSLSAIELCSRIASKFPNVELSSSQILKKQRARLDTNDIESLNSTLSTTPTPTPTPSSALKNRFQCHHYNKVWCFNDECHPTRRKCSWRA